mmetsp:Transcript_32912/g.53246  ORF Transcript_32912/g.53246 Transcript_32912/m.53246 type:complete len:145 (-) Transcript_32912:201-635(-)
MSNANTDAMVNLVFNAVDKDNNGTVDERELKIFLRQEVSFTEEEVKCVFNAFDKNNDGKISKEEFQELFVAKQGFLQQAALDPAHDLTENPGCIACLSAFAYCCCLCTVGLSCCPLYCYMYNMGRGIHNSAKEKLVAYARARQG